MARHVKKSGGGLRAFIGFTTFSISLALVCALFVVMQPQDLSDVRLKMQQVSDQEFVLRDLELVLKKSIEGEYPVTLSEAELNYFIAQKISLDQKGAFGGFVDLKEVFVRLNDGLAEVIMVREIFGREVTHSIYLQVNMSEDSSGQHMQVLRHGGGLFSDHSWIKRGGRFGRMDLPQGFLKLVISDFSKLSKALAPELEYGYQKMPWIEIKDGEIEFLTKRKRRTFLQ